MTAGRLDSVTKRYGRHAALSGVTLSVEGGEILALVGPNGAGKTTMLRILSGMMRPSSGRVEIGGSIAYFGGEHTLPPSVSVTKWLRLWGADAGPWPARSMGALSRGTRQRAGLEAMLADQSTQLVVLDEPWEGLDPDASRWLSRELQRRRDAGAAVVVSSHRIHDLADVCDRCVFLVNGRLRAEFVAPAALANAADRSALLFAEFDRLKGA